MAHIKIFLINKWKVFREFLPFQPARLTNDYSFYQQESQ